MEKCKECEQECQEEWYIPTSYGGITPFCSEECANNHADDLVRQGGCVWGKSQHPNEMIIDTGTR